MHLLWPWSLIPSIDGPDRGNRRVSRMTRGPRGGPRGGTQPDMRATAANSGGHYRGGAAPAGALGAAPAGAAPPGMAAPEPGTTEVVPGAAPAAGAPGAPPAAAPIAFVIWDSSCSDFFREDSSSCFSISAALTAGLFSSSFRMSAR